MSVKLLSIEALPADCHAVIGLLTASCCMSKSMIGDMAANVKNWTVGGELKAYTQLIDDATELVLHRLKEKAIAKGAKAVIGIRLSTTQVSEGAVELIAYRTAVK